MVLKIGSWVHNVTSAKTMLTKFIEHPGEH